MEVESIEEERVKDISKQNDRTYTLESKRTNGLLKVLQLHWKPV